MREEVEKKFKILQSLYRADLLNPFPYADCRKLLAENGENHEELIPALDAYFSNIAGLCIWGNRSLKWTDNEIAEYASLLRKSFFKTYPEFASLESSITDKNTPTLFNQLMIYDLMRLTLLDILPDIKKAKHSKTQKSPELSLAS